MRKGKHFLVEFVLSCGVLVAGCGGSHDATTRNAAGDVSANHPLVPSTTAPSTSTALAPTDSARAGKHHSKLGGAVAGAAVGHMLGGHAVAGAAAGALIQH